MQEHPPFQPLLLGVARDTVLAVLHCREMSCVGDLVLPLVTGANSSGDKDGNGREVRGQRGLAGVLRATGQVHMEFDPLNVTTHRGHLQCERATLDWGILILKCRKLK